MIQAEILNTQLITHMTDMFGREIQEGAIISYARHCGRSNARLYLARVNSISGNRLYVQRVYCYVDMLTPEKIYRSNSYVNNTGQMIVMDGYPFPPHVIAALMTD